MPRMTARPTAPQRPPRPTTETAPRGDAAKSHHAAQTGDKLMASLERAAQEILAVTYWFEPAPQPEPYAVTIRFTGRRADVKGKLQRRDRFVHDETIAEAVPGSGPISITARVRDINPGEWEVTATALGSTLPARGRQEVASVLPAAGPQGPAIWLWRKWAASVEAAHHAKTCPAPFARVPGALPLIWGAMVTLGMAVALAVQALVIAHDHLAVGPVWTWTLIAIAVGIAGAKVWYIVKHRRAHRFEGWCIQGFITGASLAAAVLFTVFHAPPGIVLDATAPGLMLGLAVGRVACFLAGCCGGPPTAARWGVWSSDQRVGARRVPTQLLESAFSLSLGLALLVAVLGRGPAGGAYFVAALAAYTLMREGLLRLRAEPLRTAGPMSAVVSALVLIAAIVVIVR